MKDARSADRPVINRCLPKSLPVIILHRFPRDCLQEPGRGLVDAGEIAIADRRAAGQCGKGGARGEIGSGQRWMALVRRI